MNLLDGLILVLAVAAAIGGFRLGFLTRAASWLGMAIGLLAAARIAPSIVDHVGREDAPSLLFAAAGLLLAGALIGQLIGLVAGSRLRIAIPGRHGQRVDQVFGAVIGVGGVFVAVWLLVPLLGSVSDWPARQADGSSIAGFVSDELPEPPDTLRGLAGLIGRQRWNDLLTDLGSGLELPAPPDSSPVGDEVAARVERSVLRIEGDACGVTVQGSGFVVAPDLVLTNAHVVAGVEHPKVASQAAEAGGSLDQRPAEVVYFDAAADLAVLRVEGLDLEPLVLSSADPTDGGVFGYPRGAHTIEVSPYAVAHADVVEVPNLDGTSSSQRSVYFLAANLQEGDSGAPLVDGSGEVAGVAFAVAPDRAGLAFAASVSELRKALAATERQLASDPSATVGTGACLERESRDSALGVSPGAARP